MVINESDENLSIRQLDITRICSNQQIQRTVTGQDMLPMFVQGNATLSAHGAAVLDVQEPADTANKCDRLLLCLGLQTTAEESVERRVEVPFVHSPTRYLRFPLDGPWFTANARGDLHCLGGQFGFDFIRPEDMKYHERPHERAMALVEFASFGQVVRAPGTGTVTMIEADQADLPALLTRSTYPDGPPKGLPPSILLGNYVLIKLDNGGCVLLAHLRRGSVLVKPGQYVDEETELGVTGNSGNTSGPHLHIELLDAEPDLDAIGSIHFGQSGMPFGFLSLGKHDGATCFKRLARVIPAKGDVVTTSRRG